MKKNIISLAVLVAAFLFAAPSQAQVKFGVKAGLNLSSISVDGKNLPTTLSGDNHSGFFAGVTADVTIPLAGLGADISLLYDNRVAKVDNDNSKTLHYIALPINVKYTFGFSSLVSVYGATGPQFAWNIGDKHWSISGIDKGWELNASSFSWNIGVGATFLSHVRVGYNYNIGIGETAALNGWQVAGKAITGKLKNNTHQIALTYFF